MDPIAVHQWAEFLRLTDVIAARVRQYLAPNGLIRLRDRDGKEVAYRRASKRERLKPHDDVERHAERLAKAIWAVPTEFFAPADRPHFLDELARDLGRLRLLNADARQVIDQRKVPDPRAQRHEAVSSTIARAYEALTGERPTCFVDSASGCAAGTFVDFGRALAPLVGLPKYELSAVIEYRRTRYRSRYPSVRAEARRR